ncbi:hypothetical protein BD413DRAFT_577120 [Trametes elegans]|nr:hypothetical protein BD413DRAFT_577120 [Trametes elegans]
MQRGSRLAARIVSHHRRTHSMPLFSVYAPDYTDADAINRRLAVREAHLTAAGKNKAIKVGGALLSPNEALDTPDAERKMIGSSLIIEAVNYAEARKLIESDVYWSGNVWDKEKTLIQPFVTSRQL